MKKEINVYQFRDEFRAHGRSDQFSYDALGWLFAWFEDYAESTGVEVDLDVIAICCDFSEDSFEDVAENYSIDLSECEDEDEKREIVLEFLNDHSIVVGHDDDSVVYQIF
jgi:hypothetical protein